MSPACLLTGQGLIKVGKYHSRYLSSYFVFISVVGLMYINRKGGQIFACDNTTLSVFAPTFQLLNHLTKSYITWYKLSAVGRNFVLVLLNFLQS